MAARKSKTDAAAEPAAATEPSDAETNTAQPDVTAEQPDAETNTTQPDVPAEPANTEADITVRTAQLTGALTAFKQAAIDEFNRVSESSGELRIARSQLKRALTDALVRELDRL